MIVLFFKYKSLSATSGSGRTSSQAKNYDHFQGSPTLRVSKTHTHTSRNCDPTHSALELVEVFFALSAQDHYTYADLLPATSTSLAGGRPQAGSSAITCMGPADDPAWDLVSGRTSWLLRGTHAVQRRRSTAACMMRLHTTVQPKHIPAPERKQGRSTTRSR